MYKTDATGIFGTIQAALNVAKAGDIVYVRSGTNPGVPAFTIPDSILNKYLELSDLELSVVAGGNTSIRCTISCCRRECGAGLSSSSATLKNIKYI